MWRSASGLCDSRFGKHLPTAVGSPDTAPLRPELPVREREPSPNPDPWWTCPFRNWSWTDSFPGSEKGESMTWDEITILVNRARAGDRQAYGELVERFQPTVYAVALARLR